MILSEKDFDGMPLTMEPDGVYQILTINGETYYRNVDTGEVKKRNS